jgi:hypothetical protein
MKILSLTNVLPLSLILALAVSVGSYANSSTSNPNVKQSSSGICHDKISRSFNRTKNFTPFDTIGTCIDAGGRLSKGKTSHR